VCRWAEARGGGPGGVVEGEESVFEGPAGFVGMRGALDSAVGEEHELGSEQSSVFAAEAPAACRNPGESAGAGEVAKGDGMAVCGEEGEEEERIPDSGGDGLARGCRGAVDDGERGG